MYYSNTLDDLKPGLKISYENMNYDCPLDLVREKTRSAELVGEGMGGAHARGLWLRNSERREIYRYQMHAFLSVPVRSHFALLVSTYPFSLSTCHVD